MTIYLIAFETFQSRPKYPRATPLAWLKTKATHCNFAKQQPSAATNGHLLDSFGVQALKQFLYEKIKADQSLDRHSDHAVPLTELKHGVCFSASLASGARSAVTNKPKSV